MMIVAAFALMTICSGLATAHADVITVNHIAHGERMLPDGGWTSACNAAVEQCLPQPVHSDTDSYGLHHHHHPDVQFGGLAIASGTAVYQASCRQAFFPGYSAVVKPTSLSATDHPPKI